MVVVCLVSSAFYLSLFSFGVVAFVSEFGVIILVFGLSHCCLVVFVLLFSLYQ